MEILSLIDIVFSHILVNSLIILSSKNTNIFMTI